MFFACLEYIILNVGTYMRMDMEPSILLGQCPKFDYILLLLFLSLDKIVSTQMNWIVKTSNIIRQGNINQ